MTTPCHRKFVAAVVGFLLSVVLGLAAPVKFEIPAQPAAAALKAFAKQSGLQVVFNPDDLQAIMCNEIKGDFEPVAALEAILKGTGATVSTGQGGILLVKKKEVKPTGSVLGAIARPKLGSHAGIRVLVRETGQTTRTDKNGDFVFSAIEPGTYTLIATGDGLQPMHITDVTVRDGRELVLSRETMRAANEVTELEPFMVRGRTSDLIQLDKYSVEGRKEKPFVAGNMDIPRTSNDAQPYYIFDAKTIEQSGATNIEDFLKQRLTMNTAAQLGSQVSGLGQVSGSPSTTGNTSAINLRGLGVDKTLILVNGRRMAAVTIFNAELQPDLNGVPMSAVDRVEVLPSSASGIYGGSAIGGVVNVILKRNYVGGEIRTTYENTWDSDAPQRSLSASYGMSLEGGRTQLLLNASSAKTEPLLLRDRRQIYEENQAQILKNNPSTFYSSATPFLGALPNITATPGQTTLTLKNGVVIPSRNTYVPPGTSSSTPAEVLYAGLAANGGTWTFDLPESTQSPTGLQQSVGSAPETKSFRASVRRQMLSNFELFSDWSLSENSSHSVYSDLSGSSSSLTIVPVDSPVNPFTTSVRVVVPNASSRPVTTKSKVNSFTIGAVAQLPNEWTGELDYARSKSDYRYNYYLTDSQAFRDIRDGIFNVFTDTLLHPLALDKYRAPSTWIGTSTLDDFSLRGFGPLRALPWGTPSLTVGLQHRIARTPENYSERNYPITLAESYRITFFERKQVTDSVYGEALVPLVRKNRLPLLYVLELQASGRSERYVVDAGTASMETRLSTGVIRYTGTTLNGQRYFSKASYVSTNGTAGLKYQPWQEMILRVSLASAFLPPTPSQLVKNVEVSSTTTAVNDPVTGQTGVQVLTLSGGNPNLNPQTSRSLNAGLIWEPRWSILKGLRLNVEYYRIRQDSAIATLTAQQIVDFSDIFSDRVTRDVFGTITLVDTSMVNLYQRETAGWDLSLDYTRKTAVGTFNLRVAESSIAELKNQYSRTLPAYESVGFPSEGGAAKNKSTGTLLWEWRGWTASWSARYFSSYQQAFSIGGPSATQRAATGATPATRAPLVQYTAPQGGNRIGSQAYHDFFVSHAFGQQSQEGRSSKTVGAKLLSGTTVQLGVKNLFDRVPPLDAYYSNNFYLSPYGDMRLRSYWITVKKTF